MKRKYSLPKAFAEQWVAALRSGEYKQGTGELTISRGDDEPGFNYCCLGVACRSVGLADNELHAYSILSPIFIKAGIPRELLETELERHFMDMNDNEGKTFTEIADFIEKEVDFI